MAACSYKNKMIFFGGGKDFQWSKVSDFYCFEVLKKDIRKKANMLTARTTHQISVIDDSIYVLG
jgi:hypothetical protein